MRVKSIHVQALPVVILVSHPRFAKAGDYFYGRYEYESVMISLSSEELISKA